MPWYVTNWAWNALYRRLMWVLFREEPVVAGTCLRCGRCCREIVLHIGGKWMRSRSDFERAKARDADLGRFEPIDKDEDGRIIFACTWVTDEGLCRDYEHRLELCRTHPSVSIYYSGVVLSTYCGYRLEGPGLRKFIRKLLGIKPKDFGDILEHARRQADSENNGTRDGEP